MGGLTQSIPKPMLDIAGKPMLEHVLNNLRDAGIERFLIVTGYYGDTIRAYFADFACPIEFVEQKIINGTGSAALLAADFAADGPFLLTFGDILCSAEDYRKLMATLDDASSGVLGVKYVDDPAAGAAVYEANGRVTRIVEKPPIGTSTTHWNSAGLYAFRPVIFDELRRIPLSERQEYELTTAICQLIDADACLRLYAIQGDWLDVGRPADLARAKTLLETRSPLE